MTATVKPPAGMQLQQRVTELKSVLPSVLPGIRVLLLAQLAKIYSGDQKQKIQRKIPYMFDYIFLQVPDDITDEVLHTVTSAHGVEVIGKPLTKTDVKWLEARQAQDELEQDLSWVGEKIVVGQLCKLVSGPYTGMDAEVVGELPNRVYKVKICGVVYTAPASALRALDYEGEDKSLLSFGQYIR